MGLKSVVSIRNAIETGKEYDGGDGREIGAQFDKNRLNSMRSISNHPHKIYLEE